MKAACFLVVVALSTGWVNAQNAIVGPGFTDGWGSPCSNASEYNFLIADAGSSYKLITQAKNIGNQHFRFGIEWDGVIEQRTLTWGTDELLNIGTLYTLANPCTNDGPMYFDVTSTAHNYIFKTRNA